LRRLYSCAILLCLKTKSKIGSGQCDYLLKPKSNSIYLGCYSQAFASCYFRKNIGARVKDVVDLVAFFTLLKNTVGIKNKS
jgi:hypothetical protein